MTAGLRHRLRAIALWAMLSPFLLLSLLPAAAMPARAADGTLTLVLCTGDGPVEMVIDLATGAPVQKAPKGQDSRCDWACGLAVLGLSGTTAQGLPQRLPQTARADLPPVTLALSGACATVLPPATGPPASA